MRAISIMLLACTLLACSLAKQRDEPAEVLQDPPPSTSSPQTAIAAAVPYFGEESLEERISKADIVVKARLDYTTSEVITGEGEGWSGKYYVALEFHLTVSEYLNGSGTTNITALTVQGDTYDTPKEAEDAAPEIVAKRDTTWDDREAIFFLNTDDPYHTFSAAVQSANDYFLTVGGTHEDMYSLHNRHRKLWLPSAGTTATSDSQEFLLAVPEPGLDTPTITLRVLKRRITSVNAELNGGDGSDAYKECIRRRYGSERQERVRLAWPGNTGPSFEPIWGGTFASGQPGGAELYDYDYGFVVTDDGIENRSKFWIDGQDAVLFSIYESERRPVKGPDRDGDGQPDLVENEKRFRYSVVSVRPIPAGRYEFNHHYHYTMNGAPACGDPSTFTIMADVLAPEGVLHELFFDPVTVGTTVSADDANGVLKPASFTGANGSSATIEEITWESGAGGSGTVKVEVTPGDGLAGHHLDFIELDGTASLSLDVLDASVDAANKTLSWSVASQPWEEGDQLMLRIREAR